MSLRSPLEGCGVIEGPGGLRLQDLSLARREGVRGVGAGEWLLNQGHTLPDAPNQIVASGESGFVMSLSHREFWLLQPDSEASTGRPASEAVAASVWPLYCQHSHAWLQLAGEPRAEVMAKLCGVDLSEDGVPAGQRRPDPGRPSLGDHRRPSERKRSTRVFNFRGSIPCPLFVGGD